MVTVMAHRDSPRSDHFQDGRAWSATGDRTGESPHQPETPETSTDALVEVKLYETELAAQSPADPNRSLPYSPQP